MRNNQSLITNALIDNLIEKSKVNPRKRSMHVLHSDAEDPVQRMLNALQPNSYIAPHRHINPPKSETIILLKGKLGIISFNSDGSIIEEDSTILSMSTDSIGWDLKANEAWHTYLALEPDTVVFEVKPGPYDQPTDKEFAPWAPKENEGRWEEYLMELEKSLT